MSVLGSYVQFVEAEWLKQKAQIQRMCEENAWLRDELAGTQQRLQLSEQRCATLDEEKAHLQFLSDLKTYETESVETAEVCCECTALPHARLLTGVSQQLDLVSGTPFLRHYGMTASVCHCLRDT